MRRLVILVCAFVLLVGAAAAPAAAQTAQVGNISGTVLDESGGALPGAMVTLTSQERGYSRTTMTDAAGTYLFPVLPLGKYTLLIELQGFGKKTLTDNLVETDKTTAVTATLKLATQELQVTVVGETPIVDRTNTTVQTRVRAEEFQKLPVVRSYQSLMAAAPGVVGTGNVNSHGALTGNNAFLMDGVDTTDPTTGTFGTNLNFEAIEEMTVYTSGVSAEYGRAVGAIVNIITKSGTNRLEGSAKFIGTNDNWNAQNSTKSETTGASLERTKFNYVNPILTFTGGGPIKKDRAWFFGNYELAKNTTAQRQTAGQTPEDYQQTTRAPFFATRISGQLTSKQNVWFKYHRVPTNGFVIDYWGGTTPAGERTALNFQDQGGSSAAFQYSGVLRPNWTVEGMFANNNEFINVFPFQVSSLNGGAPHFNQAERKYYNGATFDGFVQRPRKQATAATTYYMKVGKNSHSIKAGFDWQNLNSTNLFQYPTGSVYTDVSFNQATHAFVPESRQDYVGGASTSTGNIYSFYVRDKFDATKRFAFEVGARVDKQNGTSDVGAGTVGVTTFSPRLSANYDVAGDGKTLVIGTFGRFYQSIIQDFSDSFANIPQQTNYDNFVWNGSTYVFANAVRIGASSFKPNADLKPTYINEGTLGFQRQVGQRLGVGARVVVRNWADLIDDLRTFNADNTINRQVVNYDVAQRTYRALELTVEKRYSKNWYGAGSYTYARTRGNQFSNVFSSLGDYLDAQCRTTVDTSIGTNGVLPCAEVQNGANKYGAPANDRPHSLKFSGAYTRPVGKINLTAGTVGEATSKVTYTQTRSFNVLLPGTTTNSGNTATYLYEPLGNERLPGVLFQLDSALEATWRMAGRSEVGLKAEIFNVFDNQEKTAISNTVWCNPSNTSAACQTARDQFGTATARGAYFGPRNYRFTALFRF
jgi:hypothetical protein